jgi:hypothetical protein
MAAEQTKVKLAASCLDDKLLRLGQETNSASGSPKLLVIDRCKMGFAYGASILKACQNRLCRIGLCAPDFLFLSYELRGCPPRLFQADIHQVSDEARRDREFGRKVERAHPWQSCRSNSYQISPIVSPRTRAGSLTPESHPQSQLAGHPSTPPVKWTHPLQKYPSSSSWP